MFGLYKATNILNSLPSLKACNEKAPSILSPGKIPSQQHYFSPKKDKKISQQKAGKDSKEKKNKKDNNDDNNNNGGFLEPLI